MSDVNASVHKLVAARVGLQEAMDEVRAARSEQARARRAKADEERMEYRASLESEGLLDSSATQEVRDRVWAMAWDQGHSAGFHDVRYHYEDYAELVNLALTSLR